MSKKDFIKITIQDIEIAENFFEDESHLNEFLCGVINYYRGKQTDFTTKIVSKYFETYKKTMDFVINAKIKGKYGAEIMLENKRLSQHTLEGLPEGVLEDIPEAKSKEEIEKNKDKYILLEKFWDAYDKKVGKIAFEREWNKLSEADMIAAVSKAPMYAKANEKKFRKDPERYIRNRSWEDEIVIKKEEPKTKNLANNVLYAPNPYAGHNGLKLKDEQKHE